VSEPLLLLSLSLYVCVHVHLGMSLVCLWYVSGMCVGMCLVCIWYACRNLPCFFVHVCVKLLLSRAIELLLSQLYRTCLRRLLSTPHYRSLALLPPSLSNFGSLAPSVSLFLSFSLSLRGSHPGIQWMRPLVHFASYLLAREERLDRRTIVADIPCYLSLRARAGA